jgi:hypothetical protein
VDSGIGEDETEEDFGLDLGREVGMEVGEGHGGVLVRLVGCWH